jgi:hypothetical protein
MNGTFGWTVGDYGRRKGSVMVEECDLLRMLAARGVADPVKAAAGMLTEHVWIVLDEEAYALGSYRLSKMESAQKDEHLANLKAHRAERDRILDIYAPRPAPEPAE